MGMSEKNPCQFGMIFFRNNSILFREIWCGINYPALSGFWVYNTNAGNFFFFITIPKIFAAGFFTSTLGRTTILSDT